MTTGSIWDSCINCGHQGDVHNLITGRCFILSLDFAGPCKCPEMKKAKKLEEYMAEFDREMGIV